MRLTAFAGALFLVAVGLAGATFAKALVHLPSKVHGERGAEALLDPADGGERDAEALLDPADGSSSSHGGHMAVRTAVRLSVYIVLIAFGFITIETLQHHSCQDGVGFAWSFGVGVVAPAPLSPILFWALHGRRPRRVDMGSRLDIASGLASGLIQSTAFAGLNLAIGYNLDLTFVNSFMQLSVLIAGLWGLWFRELRGWRPICLFFFSVVLLLGGVALQKLFPLAAPSPAHHSNTTTFR